MAILNQVKTVLLLGALTGILLVAGFYFGGQAGILIALIFSILMNFGSYFFSDKVVLMIYRAKEANKNEYSNLYRIVRDITQKAKLPMPKIYIVPSNAPNAFATGRNPSHAVVACTEGILSLLSESELKGVLAHEIAHVQNRDILIASVAATIAGVISSLAWFAQWFAIGGMGRDREGQNTFGLLIMAILTPILATIIQLAISRSREYLADETGARLINNPHALASALRKLDENKTPLRLGNASTAHLFIVNPFRASLLMSLFSTHPPIADRIRRLENMQL